MHEHELELLLVRAASLVNRSVQSGGNHLALSGSSYIEGMLSNELLALRVGHSENAGESSENRVLVQMVLILGHLLADVAHEVNAASDVIGEVPLSPSLRTADDNDALLEGLSGGCGDVGLAVVVYGVAVNQTAHSQTRIRGTVLSGKHAADVGVARKGTRLLELVQVEVRNTVHHVLERLSIEALRIKLAVCHSKIVLSY